MEMLAMGTWVPVMLSGVVALAGSGLAQTGNRADLVAQNRPHYQTFPMPVEGTFPGRGIATGSVFTIGRQAEAMLSFNETNRFSFSLAGRYANNLETVYSGTITRRLPGTRGVNGFILETQVTSFASSLEDRRVMNTTGTCRIEIFDSLVVESSCTTRIPDSNTEFQGMEQF
ncbi:MAG: hypothetical protein ACHWZW_14550 [Spirulina sp.]